MNRIRELREEKRMKQSDLALLLSVKPQSVSRYETEKNDLDTDTIKRLCIIFSVTSDYLLGLSNVRTQQISTAEWALLGAYRAAPEHIKAAIDALLLPGGVEHKDAVS